MNIGVLAFFIAVVVAAYNLVMNLRANKKQKKQGNSYLLKALGKSLVLGLLAYVVVININFSTGDTLPVEYETGESLSTEYETEESVSSEYETDESTPQEAGPVSEALAESESKQEEAKYAYTFRNEQLLNDHYEKHGIYMKYKSPEKYLKGANRVIADKNTLHAIEAEDGDDVYYLERTNEFVVVSKDGYIRTYFCPEDGIDYFHRQSEN